MNNTFMSIFLRKMLLVSLIFFSFQTFTKGQCITSQPTDQLGCSYSTTPVKFTVSTSGTGLTYQWQMDEGSGFENLNITGYPYFLNNTSASTTLNVDISASWPLDNKVRKYRCIINGCTPSADTSKAAKLIMSTTWGSPITATPQDQVVCSGSTVIFSGSSIYPEFSEYKWQVATATNGFSTWTDLTESEIYEGTKTNTLTIKDVTDNMHGNKYQLIVKNKCFSGQATATLSVRKLNFTSTITDKSICSGGGASLSVNYSYNIDEPVQVQWQVDKGSGFENLSNDATYTGAFNSTHWDLNATLYINKSSASMDGYLYRSVLKRDCFTEGVVSDTAKLNVTGAPVISEHPVSATVWNGAPANFSCNSSDNNVKYKWQLKKPEDTAFVNINDGSEYFNTSTHTLTVNAPNASMNGYEYRCSAQSLTCTTLVSASAPATLNSFEQSICMVTVDEVTGKNVIVFEKPSNTAEIDSFKVYRETNNTNEFELVGKTGKNELSVVSDVNSDPTQQPYIYKITVRTIDGETFPLSQSHKTMHLTISQGIGNSWNLIWNAYMGKEVSTYNIYRGTSLNTMSMVNSVSGNITSYTDNSAPSGSNLYYQIEIVTGSCNPTARLASYNSIRSNIAETQTITGFINETSNDHLIIYPNPSKGIFDIKGIQGNSVIIIYDIHGQVVESIVTTGENTHHIASLSQGMYILEIQTEGKSIRKPLIIE